MLLDGVGLTPAQVGIAAMPAHFTIWHIIEGLAVAATLPC